ncbi:MAG: hybrid sensor histidine kinase/response regulator [Rhodospirillaceae bacterium]
MSAKIILGVSAGLGAGAALAALAGIVLPAADPTLHIILNAAAAGLAALAAVTALIGRRYKDGDVGALAALVEAIDTPRLITDADGKVLHLNRQARDWLGPESPLAFLTARIDKDREGDDTLVRLRQAATTGLATRAEVPLAGSGNEQEWFDVSVRPLVQADGTVLQLWNAVDITARRTIGDILNHERQELSDFLYFLPTGIYSVDVDGALRFVNLRFAEWLGYDPEELQGLALEDIIAGANRPQPDGEWQGEVQFRTRGGEIIPALVLQSTYDDAGVTRTRTLVVRDSMRREQAAAPGRIAYERFRSLFDAAPVAIAITDPEGVVMDCNRAFEKLVGQTRAALAGASLSEKVLLEDRRTFIGEMTKVLAGESEGAHFDVRVSGMEVAQTSVFVGPLAASALSNGLLRDGEIEGAVAHFIDVTEQKNLEAQFAQAQKMQAMGQLAGGVAHDFNNLLTAMIGFCDLLLQRHAAGDPSFADIMQIKQNSNRAANLVRQLLAFSRKQPLQPREMNITDALTEMSHLLTRLIGESIEFKLVHGRDLGLVRVDPGQFDQLIINLAVNARDAMPGGGTLTITTGAETFSTPTDIGVAEQVPAGRYVRISVADTGKGIPPEHLGRIFEPFFSTKKEIPGAGTGLGLATVYGVVRQTGGFVLVDSTVGKGSMFTIYLPRVSAEVEEAEAMREAKNAAASRDRGPESEAALAKADLAGVGNILLVEDEDAVRVFAARALKNKGYKVLEARTGEQALDILRDTPVVHLMITDMMMPGMDGGTLARLIRVERPEIRIIVISGYSEEVARGDIVDTADFHFLPKPFSLGQLASKVKEVLSEER